MHSINLRVVGIYVRIPVPVFGPYPLRTVADLLAAAASVDSKFQYQTKAYGPGNTNLSLVSASYDWTMSPPTLSGKVREPGIYSITESLHPNGQGQVTAWQYYIERPLPSDPSFRKLVSKTAIGAGFTFLDKSELLQPNDEVIFRCVAIDVK